MDIRVLGRECKTKQNKTPNDNCLAIQEAKLPLNFKGTELLKGSCLKIKFAWIN